jgi:hypothetical protein
MGQCVLLRLHESDLGVVNLNLRDYRIGGDYQTAPNVKIKPLRSHRRRSLYL